MQPRLWLDLSGIAAGSDAAVLVQRLAPALRERLQDRLVLCRRSPGMQQLDWDALAALTPVPSPPAHPGRLRRSLHRMVALGPPGTRAALRRAASLQITALRALRPPRAQAPPPELIDTALPSPGDTLVALLPFGDLSRFQAQGVRVALLCADLRPTARPDWLTPSEAQEADAWHIGTAPGLAISVQLQDIGAAGCTVLPSQRPVPEAGFILADGVIGVPGKTAELLLAWRQLLDEHVALPHLVLAGSVGDLAADVLAQLRNSDGFGGSVILWPNPTEGDRSALRDASAFTLALEPHSAWGRATLDSLAAGRPCLSAFATKGARSIDPDDVTDLAAAVRDWLRHAPAKPSASPRSWDDVSRDVVEWLAL
jgi:hypothetical protein